MCLCFVFLFCLPYLVLNGVFGDEVKSVSVKNGDFVTLHTDVVRQRDDLIVWYYGSENTLVARINGKANSTKLSEDVMFRDKLKLNDQTGDLTITHITSQHSGLYTLRINRKNKVSHKKFNLTVSGHLRFLPLNPITKPTPDLDNTELCLECSGFTPNTICAFKVNAKTHIDVNSQTTCEGVSISSLREESPAQWLIVITAVSCTAVFCVIFIIIIYMKKRIVKSSESENHLTEEKRNINSISTCEDEESSKCLNEKQQHWIEAGSV